MALIESEASYNTMRKDEANVRMHEALDRLAEQLAQIEHTISFDAAVRHHENFEAIKLDIGTLRVAADTLAE